MPPLSPDLIERRAIGTASVSAKKIVGYAIVFNSYSQDLGGFVERIQPSAVFRVDHPSVDIRALVNHDPTQVLGRTTAGTLKLARDGRGLHVEIFPPDTQIGRDTLALVERGDVSGMSVAFSVPKGGEQWGQTPDGVTLRTISNMMIHEVSIASFPAYLSTDASVAQRSLRALQQGLALPPDTRSHSAPPSDPRVEAVPPEAQQRGQRIDWLRKIGRL